MSQPGAVTWTLQRPCEFLWKEEQCVQCPHLVQRQQVQGYEDRPPAILCALDRQNRPRVPQAGQQSQKEEAIVTQVKHRESWVVQDSLWSTAVVFTQKVLRTKGPSRSSCGTCHQLLTMAFNRQRHPAAFGEHNENIYLPSQETYERLAKGAFCAASLWWASRSFSSCFSVLRLVELLGEVIL